LGKNFDAIDKHATSIPASPARNSDVRRSRDFAPVKSD
jgi:hypothetical protein